MKDLYATLPVAIDRKQLPARHLIGETYQRTRVFWRESVCRSRRRKRYDYHYFMLDNVSVIYHKRSYLVTIIALPGAVKYSTGECNDTSDYISPKIYSEYVLTKPMIFKKNRMGDYFHVDLQFYNYKQELLIEKLAKLKPGEIRPWLPF